MHGAIFFFENEDREISLKSAIVGEQYRMEMWRNILHPHLKTYDMSCMFC